MGFPTIEIIDSLNQITTIQRYTETDGYLIKVEFPNNVYIDYHIKKTQQIHMLLPDIVIQWVTQPITAIMIQ